MEKTQHLKTIHDLDGSVDKSNERLILTWHQAEMITQAL